VLRNRRLRQLHPQLSQFSADFDALTLCEPSAKFDGRHSMVVQI
jgi:hypothetical protein